MDHRQAICSQKSTSLEQTASIFLLMKHNVIWPCRQVK